MNEPKIEPTAFRTGDWIATASGTKWFLTDPHPNDVRIDDIAHALAMVCRFGGHCREFYSVAEHSVRMAEVADFEHGIDAAMWALIHDAPEAYLGDMVRPLKSTMPDYRRMEARTEEVIIQGLGFKPVNAECRAYVKHLDDVLLMTERRDLVNHCGHDWTPRAEPLPGTIVPMSPMIAKAAFLGTFQRLLNDGGMQ